MVLRYERSTFAQVSPPPWRSGFVRALLDLGETTAVSRASAMPFRALRAYLESEECLQDGGCRYDRILGHTVEALRGLGFGVVDDGEVVTIDLDGLGAGPVHRSVVEAGRTESMVR
jgi:hypothetical protein